MQANKLLKGRPTRLLVLDYGLFRVHANGRIIGISGFLVQTDQGENVLIDSGFPDRYAGDAKAATLADGLESFGEVLSITPENRAEAQLALAGVGPDEIGLFITTHTHIDHIGGLDRFGQAPLVISRAERALTHPLNWRTAPKIEWPKRDYVLVDGDTEIGPGFDVFLVPGHAPGQLAMLLDLPKTGKVLLTSDAISRPAEIDEGFDTAPDPARALAEAHRLMELAYKADAFVIYGHCPKQWPELRKAPEFYD